jgi:hypothetical protein
MARKCVQCCEQHRLPRGQYILFWRELLPQRIKLCWNWRPSKLRLLSSRLVEHNILSLPQARYTSSLQSLNRSRKLICFHDSLDSDCETTFQQTPVCADSSWNLWNATTEGQYGGFFCCQQDQIGDNTGGCWPPGTIPISTDRAILVSSAWH